MSVFFTSLAIFFVTYWIPGWLALRWTKASTTYQTLLALPLGIALWGWQGWIFGWLHITWGAFTYLGLSNTVFLWTLIRTPIIFSEIGKAIRGLWKDKISIFILLLGVASQSLVLWNVLQPTNNTWVSCCGDTNDNIWYASITKSIIENFPPQYPGITGQIIHNYHYWSNLVIANIVQVFHIDQIMFQFRYSGLMLSLFLGITLIALSTSLFPKPIFTRWILFLFYFGGDFIYLIPLIQKHVFSLPGSSLEDGVRFLSNPPRSYAVILSLVWIALFIHWRSKINIKRTCVLSLLFAATIGFKVYVAFFLLAGLGVLTLYDLTQKRYETLKILVASFAASALVYLPVNSQAGGLYFVGFWRFENFVSQPGFNLIRLEMARMIFYEDHKYWKAGIFDLLFMAIYTTCIFGTKLIGLIPIPKRHTNFPKFLHVLLVSGLITQFIIGAFFQQNTGGSNTFNFHVNVFLFLSFYAALVLTQIHDFLNNHKRIYIGVTMVFILLTIPRATHELFAHIHRVRTLTPVLSPDVQKIVMYLRETPKDTLVAINAKNIGEDEKGPYMYWFTNRHQYLSAPNLLTQFGANTFDRERNIQTFAAKSGHSFAVKKLLEAEHIDYFVLDSARFVEASRSAYWLVPVIKTERLTLVRVDLERLPPLLEL